jgi:hypothetical protein
MCVSRSRSWPAPQFTVSFPPDFTFTTQPVTVAARSSLHRSESSPGRSRAASVTVVSKSAAAGMLVRFFWRLRSRTTSPLAVPPSGHAASTASTPAADPGDGEDGPEDEGRSSRSPFPTGAAGAPVFV